MGNRYHGKGGRLFLSTDGSTAPSPAVSLSKWALDMSTDTDDTTCFEDGNKTAVQGYGNRNLTFSGFFDSSNDAIFDAAESTSGAYVILYPAYTGSPGKYFYGPTWMDVTIDVDVNGAVNISGKGVANGTWGRV